MEYIYRKERLEKLCFEILAFLLPTVPLGNLIGISEIIIYVAKFSRDD